MQNGGHAVFFIPEMTARGFWDADSARSLSLVVVSACRSTSGVVGAFHQMGSKAMAPSGAYDVAFT